MLEFSKTRAGKKFIEHDIPSLVEALNKLASSLNESNKIEEKKLIIEHKRYLNEKNAGITRSSEDDNIAEQSITE
jgi:hypothetical protein